MRFSITLFVVVSPFLALRIAPAGMLLVMRTGIVHFFLWIRPLVIWTIIWLFFSLLVSSGSQRDVLLIVITNPVRFVPISVSVGARGYFVFEMVFVVVA